MEYEEGETENKLLEKGENTTRYNHKIHEDLVKKFDNNVVLTETSPLKQKLKLEVK